MKIAIYPFIKRPESYYYEFFSEGPNGSIKKVVEHYRLQELEAEVFDLAFGDWDEDSHRINDLSVSKNDDKGKVLATVAATITDFMKDHPDAIVIATGGTLSELGHIKWVFLRYWMKSIKVLRYRDI